MSSERYNKLCSSGKCERRAADTIARILRCAEKASPSPDMLARGTSIYDAVKMLADTVNTVAKQYAQFVPAARDAVQIKIDGGAGIEEQAELSQQRGKKLVKRCECGITAFSGNSYLALSPLPQAEWLGKGYAARKLLEMEDGPCKPESSGTFLFSISCLESTNAHCQRSQFRQQKQDLCHSYGTVF